MLDFCLVLILLFVFWLIWGRGALIVLRHKDDEGILLPQGYDKESVMERLKKDLSYAAMEEIYYNEDGNICIGGKYAQYALEIREGRLFCWSGGSDIKKGEGIVCALASVFAAFDRGVARETEEIECIRAYILKIFDHDAPINARTKYTAMETAAHRSKLAILGIVAALTILIFIVLDNNGVFNDNSDDIQASYFTQYSETITIGQAFEDFFADSEWVDYEQGASEYVDFKGECLWDDERAQMLMTFTISGQRFEITSIKINGEEIPVIFHAELLQAIYDSYGK